MTRRTAAALVTLALLAATACGEGDDGSSTALPAVVDETAETFRLVYAVTTPEATSTEEHQVRRPFDSHTTVRDSDGDVTTERWSSLGSVVTRAAGSPASGLSIAVAPALGDSRLDRFAAELVTAGRAVEGERRTVRGRACTVYTAESLIGTQHDGGVPDLAEAAPLRAVVDRCVDAQGLVLEERWSTPGGERLLTKRVIELEIDNDLELDLAAPGARVPSAEEGNGTVAEIRADTSPPFMEQFALDPPSAYTHVGRYSVLPPRVGDEQTAGADAQLALITDVWVRGADLLLLDQGAGSGGATPFDPATAWRTVTVAPFGELTLAGDARAAEVRIPRPAGGFVRLSGTVPVDELLELAADLRSLPG